MIEQEELALNIRAFWALGGASLNWRADLEALFRSGATIEPWVRERLADLVKDGKSKGPRLDLRNTDRNKRHHATVAARYEWMQIGRWMKARVSEGCTVEEARWRASEQFGAMEGKCKDAWDYYRPASAWVEQRMTTEFGQIAGSDVLETIYHQIYADPADQSFLRMNEQLLHELELPHFNAAGG